MLKRFSKALLFTMVIAAVALSANTEVNAKVCILYLGGTCIFWSGSIEADLSVDGLENYVMEPKFFELKTRPMPDTGPQEGVLFCEDPANPTNRSADIRQLTASNQIIREIVTKTKILSQFVNDQGKARMTIVHKLTEPQLNNLDTLCGGSGYKAKYFVFEEFEADVRLLEYLPAPAIDEVTYECKLPRGVFQGLEWDNDTNKPEARQYKCKIKR
jgi:hypothetical protein